MDRSPESTILSLLPRLTDQRISDPDFPLRVAGERKRRSRLTADGRLNLLAIDHPARRVTKGSDDPLEMANRPDVLHRVCQVLASEWVDGVMATMDVLEELLILDGLLRRAGEAPLLDEKLLVASLNRGGLAGTRWEMNDPITGPTATTCAQYGLDGAKFLLRICDDEEESLVTLLEAARAIREMNASGLPTFLEPLPVVKTEKGYGVVRTPEALARIAGVASALGDSSRRLWLKLPYCERYEIVARATTLPILLLGGESAGDAEVFLREVAEGLAAGPNVRGALVGRNILYPGELGPRAAADAVGRLIHGQDDLEVACRKLQAARARSAAPSGRSGTA
jgi:DhnA family fructose-bisphosphate aldolase class Ia